MKRTIHAILAALVGATLASCGGGGGLADGGIGGTGISRGSVSAFGSIVVNGRRFEVDAAEITVNGDPATQSALEVGYVVLVEGDFDDGIAEGVRFEADVMGEVDANGIGAGEDTGTLTAMQQTVRVTATTIIDGVDGADQITGDDRLLVSGFRNSGDEIVASHIRVLGAAGVDQVVGRVTAANGALGCEFEIGSLKVNCVNASPQTYPGGSRDVGDRLVVRGSYDGTDTLDADTVVPAPDLEADEDDEVELEGIVDTLTSQSAFTVEGIPVDASGAVIEGTIQKDAELEVEGAFNAAGTLVAERVEVELEDNVEIVARLVQADPDAGTAGTVSLFAASTGALVTVDVTPHTRLRDSSDSRVPDFGVDDLASGDWVELDGFEDASGAITALQIERIEAESEVRLEGIVDAEPTATTATILGVVVEPDNSADLDGIQQGDIAEARWPAAESFQQPMPVDSVELED